MANIIRYGTTPLWGVYQDQASDGLKSGKGIILDSYNYSIDVKDYEQLDSEGRVTGYLVYDQSISFDASGTLLYNNKSVSWDCHNSTVTEGGYDGTEHTPNQVITGEFGGVGDALPTAIVSSLGGYNAALSSPTTAIVKSYSVNTSQGNAATFSLSGTIYGFLPPAPGWD